MDQRSSEQLKEDGQAGYRETIECKEAALLLGLSEWTVYDLAKKKILPHCRVGSRRILFRRKSLLAWLEAQEQASVLIESAPAAGRIRRLR